MKTASLNSGRRNRRRRLWLTVSLLAAAIASRAGPGDVDMSFDPGSTLGFGPFFYGTSYRLTSSAVQNDGKVLISGGFQSVHGISRNRLARLNADGSLDQGFLNGLAGLDGIVWAFVIQGDGKILIGGDFVTVNGTARPYLARLNPDGSLDVSFLAGMVGPSARVQCLVLQTNRQILVGGNFTNVNGIARSRLARLNADGSVDATFLEGLSGFDREVYALSLQDDGRVLVGGDFAHANDLVRGKLARVHPNGSLDTTFLDGPSGLDGPPTTIIVQADGRVLISGYFSSVNNVYQSGIARLEANGNLDTNFVVNLGGGGIIWSPPRIALQADGKIIVGANFSNVNDVPMTCVARLNADGSLDESFRGAEVTENFDMGVYSVSLQNDGRVVISGGFSYRAAPAGGRYLCRLNSDGTLDDTFNAQSGADDLVRAVVRQPDGKVLIGGYLRSISGHTAHGVGRLDSGGLVDPTFTSALTLTFFQSVRCLMLQADGKVLVGGEFETVNGLPRRGLVRLNADGTADTTFLNGMSGPNGSVYSLCLVNGGKIIISGSFSSVNGSPVGSSARLHPDGTLDTSFQQSLGAVNALAVRNDGETVVGGDAVVVQPDDKAVFATGNSVAREDDPSFHPTVTGPYPSVKSLLLQPDGKILLGGEFLAVNGVARTNLARLNADGSIDLSFMNGLAGPNGAVNSLAMQPDGTILAGGQFLTVNGASRGFVARLESGFTPFPSVVFPPENLTVPPGSPASFQVQADGALPLSYQWYFSVTNRLDDATNTQLHLPAVDYSQAGDYTVVITNSYGSVTSPVAALTVLNPFIVTHPVSQTVRLGSNATFSVAAVGLPLPDYRWLFNATNAIPNATNEVLELKDVQFAQAGTYRVLVSNSNGVVESSPATLTVTGSTVTECTEAILRLAMAEGGTVTFACDGTIVLSNTIVIVTNTVLDASGHQVTISGGNSVRVFHVSTNVSFSATHLTIANGRSTNGGGIYNDRGTLTLRGCVMRTNVAFGGTPEGPGIFGETGAGGGVYNLGAMFADNCLFVGNRALGAEAYVFGGSAEGGAIYNAPSATCRVSNGTIHANVAHGGTSFYEPFGGQGGTASGGGIYSAGQIQMVNVTLASNTGLGGDAQLQLPPGQFTMNTRGGDAQGGNILSAGYGFVTNCTMVDGLVYAGRGAIWDVFGNVFGVPNPGSTSGDCVAASGFFAAKNTILSGHVSASAGTFVDAGHNLGSSPSLLTNTTSRTGINLMLGPLGAHDGPTPTVPLLSGSPAIDAADSAAAPPTDQRGFARVGPADIGAFEYWAAPPSPPGILQQPLTQTAELGYTARISVTVTGYPPPSFQWYLNGTTAVPGGTSAVLELNGLDPTDIGEYTLVVNNPYGCATSTPAMLNVIPPVERRMVPGLHITSQPGGELNLEFADVITPPPLWSALDSGSLAHNGQDYFDLTQPLPAQRFYRGWQTDTTNLTLNLELQMIPALTLTGNVNDSIRVNGINQFGPTDAWFTLDTVTLTNTSQLYFDVTAPGQPPRLYRLVPLP